MRSRYYHPQSNRRKLLHPVHSLSGLMLGITALVFMFTGMASTFHQPYVEFSQSMSIRDANQTSESLLSCHVDSTTAIFSSIGLLKFSNTGAVIVILLLMYQNTIGRLARERQQNKNLQNKKRRDRTRRKLRLAQLNQEDHPS